MALEIFNHFQSLLFRFRLADFPFFCGAFKVPQGSNANMVVYIEELGLFSIPIAMPEEDWSTFEYPVIASWNIGQSFSLTLFQRAV